MICFTLQALCPCSRRAGSGTGGWWKPVGGEIFWNRYTVICGYPTSPLGEKNRVVYVYVVNLFVSAVTCMRPTRHGRCIACFGHRQLSRPPDLPGSRADLDSTDDTTKESCACIDVLPAWQHCRRRWCSRSNFLNRESTTRLLYEQELVGYDSSDRRFRLDARVSHTQPIGNVQVLSMHQPSVRGRQSDRLLVVRTYEYLLPNRTHR
jgi:hypothetical protein